MKRARRLLVLNRLQSAAERRLSRELASLFKKTVNATAEAVRAGEDLKKVYDQLGQALETTLRRSYWRASLGVRDEVYRQIRAAEGKSIQDVFEKIVMTWISKWVGEKVKTLVSSYRGTVQTVIATSFEEGLGQEATAQLLRSQVGKEYAQWKAARIARTEMAAASNLGSDAAARSTGLSLVKEWAAADDARTRPTHARADGQLRNMDDPFTIGDYQMAFPGDPSGPAGEVINCRCVVLYHPQGVGDQ